MRTVAFMIAVSSALVFAPLRASADPVSEVLSVKAGIGPAMRTQDRAALEKIWSPQMKVNSPSNAVVDRPTVLSLLVAGNIKYSAYKDVLESSSVFDGVVVLMGREELTEAVGADAGKAKVRRYTDIWQRNGEGNWMLVARQATYIATP